MKVTLPADVYQEQIVLLIAQQKIISKRRSAIAWSRLASLLAAVAAFYFLREKSLAVAVLMVILFFALFLRLVVLAINAAQKSANLDRLIAINQQELEVAAGNYHHLPDGAIYLPDSHPYAYDLDIFGRSSLFQYINRTTTEQGSATLAAWFLKAASPEMIPERQQAAKELASLLQWRQQLQAYGKANTVLKDTQQKIEQWLTNEGSFFSKPIWKFIRWLGPLAALSVLGLYITDIIVYQVFFLWLFCFFLITGYISKKATPAYRALQKIAPEIGTLSEMIRHIEEQTFESHLLQQHQQQFFHQEEKASNGVKKLNGILSRMDYRLNPAAFIPLNIFLFWDLQQMLHFEKWKKQYAGHISRWFEAVGQIEALSSLATVAFNHPQWVFPVIQKEQGTFQATGLGHPLIDEKKVVRSSFATNGNKVTIITGSNMAGKSTFLRSVGLALVMGEAGAPVCASSAAFSPMEVMSTMRISDNLEESTSTFYAELKKLKSIIEAVNKKEKLFFLMDEILRGTNSLDRHTGSRALIEQFIRHSASGIIATHDLALAELEKEHPDQIDNYHFDVQVAGEELYFDYKLKEGVCQSLNASVLMKKIGIEMN